MKKRILLDAGHGGPDDGATSHGFKEDDIALEIVIAAGKILEKLLPDYDICYMRIGDKAVSLHKRHSAIMELEPLAFVSVHCNAIQDDPSTPYDDRKYAKGYEIFYRDDRDKPLAYAIDRVVHRSELWTKRRGVKQDETWLGKRLTVLDSLEVPSILWEIGFLSNDEDRKLIVENIGGFADLLAHGTVDYVREREANYNVTTSS